MLRTRTDFLEHFCNKCAQPIHCIGCGQVFGSILEPIACPIQLTQTHDICRYCLELHPKIHQHDTHCLFVKHNLTLRAAGWSTPTSNSILRSMRTHKFAYKNPVINLIYALLSSLELKDTILIPVPMASIGKKDRWTEMIGTATADLETVEVLPILTRQKQLSTRQNPPQLRKQIIQEEYSLCMSDISMLKGRSVILLDDNVTTGNTMTYLAHLLRQFGPREIIPVAIERYVTARVLQRCPQFSFETCPYFQVVDDRPAR